MSRKSPIFSREDSIAAGNSVPDWFSEFASNLQKQSVKSREQDKSTFDQISEIMGGKQRFSTVEDAVRDYSERTGLNVYLKNLAGIAATIKNASLEVQMEGNFSLPEVFNNIPNADVWLRNYIDGHFGEIDTIAVLKAMSERFRHEGFTNDIESDPTAIAYVDALIGEHQKANESSKQQAGTEDGKVDTEVSDNDKGDDAFAILMPASI